ncbi:MADF domain-containing protein [Trichonephila clavata]|uniref:MADF domain-containing protein n=1 Tax=Trichonephila clavata TaxID=2740835 RepID=A0A8X6JNN3_TRICU|nr:MADF domain-containing protein [Trichonephila clavata]
MEWSQENLLKLIDLYKTKSLLWHPKHPDYFKKKLKEDAWREIGNELNVSADQCKKKMVCLLASHRRERNKIKNRNRKRANNFYVSKWFAYNALSFLEDRDLPRKTLTTETEWILGIENDIESGVTPSEQWEPETTASTSIPKSNKRIKTKEEDTSASVVRITPSEQWEQETTASSSISRPSKRITTKEEDTSASMVNKALDILKTAAKLDKEVPESNEIDSFFTYVAAKVRKYSPEAQKTVQHAVFDILMKADNGLFD